MVSDVAAKVRNILVFHLGVEEARLSDDARLVEDLGADSLDLVEIVMSCEERFDIEAPNRIVGRLATVADIVDFIEATLAGATEPASAPASAPMGRFLRLRLAFR